MKETDGYCSLCDVHLDYPAGEVPPEPSPPPRKAGEETAESELARLRTVVSSVRALGDGELGGHRSRGIPASALITVSVVVSVAALVTVVKLRERARAVAPEAPLVNSVVPPAPAVEGD